MKIVYACDDNYAGLTAVSAVSLLKHNPEAEIILIGFKLKPESIEKAKTQIERYGGKFRYADVSAKIDDIQSAKTSPYVSYAVYSRIFISDLLPDISGRILYLDCDTLIVDSIRQIFETDMQGLPLALAPDMVHPAYKKVISLPDDRPYYNTGVALIDLDEWRNRDCTNRLIKEIRNPHGSNPLGDQDIIVRVLNTEIKELERKWNFLSQYILCKRKERPAIYHFSGNTMGRPWYTSSHHPMREMYRQAAKDANMPELAEQSRKLPVEYEIQYALFRILPQFLFRPLYYLMLRTHIYLTYKK